MRAYVLIQTIGDLGAITPTVQAIPGIVSTERVGGPYDVIAIARIGSSGRAIQEIIEDIRSLPGVLRALPAVLTREIPGPGGLGGPGVTDARVAHEAA